MSIFYILVVLTAISELFLLSERDNSINVIKENQREMSYMVTEYNNRIHEITENNIELQEENHVMAEILWYNASRPLDYRFQVNYFWLSNSKSLIFDPYWCNGILMQKNDCDEVQCSPIRKNEEEEEYYDNGR